MPANQNIDYDYSDYQVFEFEKDSLLITEAKIQSYSAYPEGWCYGEGLVFSRAVINAAITLNALSMEKGFLNTDTFPGPDGGIKLAIYQEDICLEFTINSDLTIIFVREEGENEPSPLSLSLDEAKNKINDFAEEIWSLGCSKANGTTGTVVYGWTTHSSHQLTR